MSYSSIDTKLITSLSFSDSSSMIKEDKSVNDKRVLLVLLEKKRKKKGGERLDAENDEIDD